ncbi:Abi family protein [Altererythrobacter sp. H2]|uniref:Abi family protein n=1 Tax=Altererythrobacter sp. H2 TaxID=3108391 RepID=UPI003A5CCCED
MHRGHCVAGTDWKSFADQLQILKDRGLTVGDDTRAIGYLEKIGYYCLSGYWYPFRAPKAQPVGLVFREDHFLPGSTFEDAVALYAFDRKLRLLALDALERIERAIRVDVALGGDRDLGFWCPFAALCRYEHKGSGCHCGQLRSGNGARTGAVAAKSELSSQRRSAP